MQLERKAKDVLSLYMLRRDEKSTIRGKIVMTDYFKLCTNYEEPIIPQNDKELKEREELYRKNWAGLERVTQRRNDNMRCLSFSYRFIQWSRAKGSKQSVWEGYTLDEARRQCRTKKLIDILLAGKNSKNGVIIFVQRTFLAEFSLMVCPDSLGI